MDHVERTNRHIAEMASEKRAKPKRRQDRIDDSQPPWEVGVGSSEKYRENWGRIFGGESGDSIPAASAESSG